MNPALSLAALALLLGGGVLAWQLSSSRAPAPGGIAFEGAGSPGALPASAPSPGGEEQLPPEATRKYPPYSMIPLRLPKVKSGIRCPDGSFLPLLNGVPRSAAISRYDWLGPVTPVIAKHVDATGCEWWVHADNSMTTSRFIDTFDATGKLIPNIETVHAAPMPERGAVPIPSPDPTGKPSGTPGGGIGTAK
jgi:hypothetical protein